MTFEEAKKILKKEGFYVEKATIPCAISESFIEYEDPTICEAMQVVDSAGYGISMESSRFDERKARLKKEYKKSTKAPGSGEEQSKEKKGIIYPSTSPKADFYYKHVLNEGNPALKEAASQFNDALLDAQGKKIKRLGKEISRLNKIIHKKNEELRLTKIREKNLAEFGLKYVGENEELKKELADKVVDKIDAQALKSAESALAWKEKTITYKDMALAYYEKKIAEKDEVIAELREKLKSINMNRHNERICKKQLAEKDEVIADLCNELAATKKELEEKTNLVEIVRNASKDYCDYGVAANEFIKKLANLYVIAGSKGTISNEMFERCKNYQTYGFPANCNKETKKEIDDIARGKVNKKPRIHTPEISEEELMKIQEKVVASCDIAEEGGDYSATIVQCGNVIALSKEEAEIIERCTKNGTELHYSEKDGFTYTNVFDKEMPIRCLRGMFHAFTDEEIENMKK